MDKIAKACYNTKMTKTLSPRELQAVALDNFWDNNLYGLPDDVVEDMGYVPFHKIAEIGRTTVGAAFKGDTTTEEQAPQPELAEVINIDRSPYNPTQYDLTEAKSRHPAGRRRYIETDPQSTTWRLTPQQRQAGLSGVENARKILNKPDENDQTN